MTWQELIKNILNDLNIHEPNNRTLLRINAVLGNLGIDPLPEGTVLEDILPESKSRSGDGAAAGSGNGTSNSVASTDNSIANMSNAP